MSEIVWEAPPNRTGHNERGRWITILAPLVERPGEWARVDEQPTPKNAGNVAANLRGVLKKPPGRWEFASRTVDGKGYVYARYLGPHEASA